MRRPVLAGVVTACVSVALVLVSAVPAMASPLGTGPVCDDESPYQICLSANGTEGNNVYGKTYSTDKEEHTTVAAANVCAGTDVVDGGNTTCPFAQGSGHLNDKYQGDTIVQMYNSDENNMYYLGYEGTGADGMVQGKKGTGYMWVLAPVSQGSSKYYLINVAISGDNQAPWFACSFGANQAVLLSSSFLGGGACEWSFP